MSDTLPNEVREAAFDAAFAVLIDPASPGPNIPLETADDLAAVKQCTRMALDAALSALEAAGWVCVPVEPTSDMVEYGRQDALNPASLDWMELGYRHGRNTMYAPSLVRRIWERMIAATPLTASNPKEKPMGSLQDRSSEDK